MLIWVKNRKKRGFHGKKSDCLVTLVIIMDQSLFWGKILLRSNLKKIILPSKIQKTGPPPPPTCVRKKIFLGPLHFLN